MKKNVLLQFTVVHYQKKSHDYNHSMCSKCSSSA